MFPADRRGFSLLEAVIAVAVVSLAGVAALTALAGELRSSRRAREALTVSALVEHRMETLRLLPADALRLLPDSLESGHFAPPFDTYEWTAAAKPVPGVDGVFDVSVVVEGPEGELRLDTRLYRPDLLPAP
ncbi:MAG TPA: type II secretion system protein [Longimicrobium sp.]